MYRLTQLLEREGVYPVEVVISAIQPPQTKRQILTHLSNEAFVQHIAEMGGIPKELLENKPMMDYLRRPYVQIYQALETFQHKDQSIIETPVYLFNGTQDEKCMQDANGWLPWAKPSNAPISKEGTCISTHTSNPSRRTDETCDRPCKQTTIHETLKESGPSERDRFFL
ncbi:thioesterase domain-containing protein [Bacillus sp. SL00103]